jgi:hypothetical protein
MADVPLDPREPPEERPDRAARHMVWRLAVRMHRDHGPTGAEPGEPGTCPTCREPWPCRARRMAERGLIAACGGGHRSRGCPSYPDWFPSSR